MNVENSLEKSRALCVGFWDALITTQQNRVTTKINGNNNNIKTVISKGIENKEEMPQIFLGALKKALYSARTTYPKCVQG